MRIKNENMKKYLIIMAVPLMMLSSCEENMEDLFPSEYQKVLSIKNSGQSSLVMASASFGFGVIRSGYHRPEGRRESFLGFRDEFPGDDG